MLGRKLSVRKSVSWKSGSSSGQSSATARSNQRRFSRTEGGPGGQRQQQNWIIQVLGLSSFSVWNHSTEVETLLFSQRNESSVVYI